MFDEHRKRYVVTMKGERRKQIKK